MLTNGALDNMFNLEVQVINNVQDNNDDAVSTKKGKVNS